MVDTRMLAADTSDTFSLMTVLVTATEDRIFSGTPDLTYINLRVVLCVAMCPVYGREMKTAVPRGRCSDSSDAALVRVICVQE